MEPEVDFPRGGAGVLTALEIRDVKHQAKQDVLFKDVRGFNVDDSFVNVSCRKEKSKMQRLKRHQSIKKIQNVKHLQQNE